MYNLNMEALFNIPISIIVISILFRITAFENQRWVRLRASGTHGSNQAIGVFVDLAMPLAGLLWYLFLIAFFVDTSFLTALCLYLIPFVTTLLWGFISRDNIFIWAISSIVVVPIGIYLVIQTSLFGLLS